MTWQKIFISQFGGPEVLDLIEESTIPEPGPGEVRIKVLAAGTGFTDIFIRRGRYPDYKGPLPFIPGYDIVGLVDKVGPGVASPHEGQTVADLCVVGGYTQYAIRPAQFLVPVPTALIPPRRSASRWLISPHFKCSPVTGNSRPVQRFSRSEPREPWARHCSTWRVTSV